MQITILAKLNSEITKRSQLDSDFQLSTIFLLDMKDQYGINCTIRFDTNRNAALDLGLMKVDSEMVGWRRALAGTCHLRGGSSPDNGAVAICQQVTYYMYELVLLLQSSSAKTRFRWMQWSLVANRLRVMCRIGCRYCSYHRRPTGDSVECS